MRLVDTRFHGMAMGVGTQKIIGKVHAVEIQINDKVLTINILVPTMFIDYSRWRQH